MTIRPRPPVLAQHGPQADLRHWAREITSYLHRLQAFAEQASVVQLAHRDASLGDSAKGENGKVMFCPDASCVVVSIADAWVSLVRGDAALITGTLETPSSGELTIASGAITPTGFNHTVDTESDAVEDDLTTITLAADQWLFIRPASGARDLILTETGNIEIPGGEELVLRTLYESALLYCDGTKWVVVSTTGEVTPASVFSSAFSVEFA